MTPTVFDFDAIRSRLDEIDVAPAKAVFDPAVQCCTPLYPAAFHEQPWLEPDNSYRNRLYDHLRATVMPFPDELALGSGRVLDAIGARLRIVRLGA